MVMVVLREVGTYCGAVKITIMSRAAMTSSFHVIGCYVNNVNEIFAASLSSIFVRKYRGSFRSVLCLRPQLKSGLWDGPTWYPLVSSCGEALFVISHRLPYEVRFFIA